MISEIWDYLIGWSAMNKSMEELFECIDLVADVVVDLRQKNNILNTRIQRLEHILNPQNQPPPPPPQI